MRGSIPKPDPAVRAVLALQPARIETALGAVECAQFGAGPAVLALHGVMGGCDQGLMLARAALGGAAGIRVVSVSRPGYLGTPLGTARSPERQADLWAALLDRLGIQSALILAISAAGPSALHFALRHRSRCAGLVLISPCTGRLDVPPAAARRLPFIKFAARVPWLANLLRWLAEHNPERAAAWSILDREVLRRTLRHPEAGPLIVALHNSVTTRLAQRMPGALNDIEQLTSTAPIPLAQVEVPAFVIHGTGDRVVPVSHARRVASALPGAQSVFIEKGEHVVIFTHLEQVRAALTPFVARCLGIEIWHPAGLPIPSAHH